MHFLPGIAQGITRRGVPESRVITAPNGCDLELFVPDTAQPLPEISGLPLADAFVATFTGAHGVANGLGAVLDAAATNRARGGVLTSSWCLLVTGRKKPALIERAHRDRLVNCLFVDPMPKKALAQFLCRRANVGLMILANVPAFYYGNFS